MDHTQEGIVTASKNPKTTAPKKTAAKKAPVKKKAPAKTAPVEVVETAEVVGNDEFDTRAGARRYAALKALESGIKVELAEVGRELMSSADKLGVASFSSEFGKLTVAQRSATFTVNDQEAYFQHFRDNGAGHLIESYEEPDVTKIDEIIAVLREHAPELIRTNEYVPEFLEVSFQNSLVDRKVTARKPVLDGNGEQVMDIEANPMTGEAVETPVFEVTEEVKVFQKVKTTVPQDDGSEIEQIVEIERPFISAKPGSVYMSYPASKEQKIAKARAAAFFESGDLEITKAIPRSAK